MTRKEREQKEYESLFTDERYAKKAWKQFIGQSLQGKAVVLPDFEDSKGNTSPQSLIYSAAFNNVKARLRAQGLERDPMQAEVIVESNVIRAAFDNNVFNTILDRTAGKVKEEINISASAFEELTDEELEVLALHRANQKLLGGKDGQES